MLAFAGYLIIPGWATQAQCRAMMAHANELVDGYDPEQQKSVFDTKEDNAASG